MVALQWVPVGCLIAALVLDLRHRQIADGWSVAILICAGISELGAHRFSEFGIMLGAAMVLMLIHAPFYGRNMIGGGDIKLMSACLPWIGPERVADFLIATGLLGGLLSLGALAHVVSARRRIGGASRAAPRLPFACAIAPAALFAWSFGTCGPGMIARAG